MSQKQAKRNRAEALRELGALIGRTTIVRRGDVVILSATRELTVDERQAIAQQGKRLEQVLGVRFVLLTPDVEILEKPADDAPAEEVQP